MADWPSTLPDWRAAFKVTAGSGVLRTDNSTGPAATRQRSSAVPDEFQVGPLYFTGDQLATLRTFFKTTLKGGAVPFDDVDPIDDSPASYKIIDVEWGNVRGSPTPGARIYRVSMTMEQLP